MKNFLKLLILVFVSLFILACGSSSNSIGSTSNNLNIGMKNAKLNTSKSKMSIDFVISNPYSSKVDVRINNLSLLVDPCGIDSVVFSPNEITFEEKKEKIINAVITFNESCTPTSYQLKGSTYLTLEGNTNNVLLDSSIQKISPEENQTISGEITEDTETNTTEETNSSVDTINYGIKFSLEDEDVMRFNLEDKKSIQIALIDKDKGNFISAKNIISLKVTSKQENILKLFDSNKNTTPSSVVSYEKINNITVYVQTYTRSGLAAIDVEIKYLNASGGTETIRKTYSTMIQSGPPTAFSINTAGVSYNFETKWFENKFLISAVDRYNNIVNISPTIYVSAMTGFTRDSNGKEVLYGNFGDVEGKLEVDKESKTVTFEANSSVFDNIDVNRDYLYVFGKINDYEALGKWDIDSYDSSHTSTVLALSEAFNGENHDKLGFALGHNYMIDPGSSESAEWQLKIDSTDGKYQLDEEGKAFVTLKFPPYIVGKRTALAVNFLGKTPETGEILRSGEVKFKTLSSFSGVDTPDSIAVEKDTQGSVTARRNFYINTGTGDSWRVLNSHVSCDWKTTNVIVESITQNNIVDTVQEFIDNGHTYGAFWNVRLRLVDATKAGSFAFSECQVRNLPLF